MSDELTPMEIGALKNFLVTPGPLLSGLAKFISALAWEHKASCAAAMATVPRSFEVAADNAAKAQVLDEFWATLEDTLKTAPESPPDETL
jgi:hypothetical protein